MSILGTLLTLLCHTWQQLRTEEKGGRGGSTSSPHSGGEIAQRHHRAALLAGTRRQPGAAVPRQVRIGVSLDSLFGPSLNGNDDKTK